jgi:tetratricopeptide (TPR) repeat protein
MRSRLDAAAAAHALTPFVGRNDESQILQARWERARKGEGQVISIVGEAGVGKSRLVHQFRDQIAEVPHTWIECAGSPLFENAPFHPVSELLEQAFSARADKTPEARLHELETRLQAVGFDLAEAVPLISPLLNLPLPERYPQIRGAPERRHRELMAMLSRWVIASAQVQPLVLVVEDLQWVDPSTLDLQELLAERGGDFPILLLYTSRPEFRPPWPLRAHHVQLNLNRLSHVQARELIAGVAGRRQITDEGLNTVTARAEGVPLFAEELARLVIDTDRQAAPHEIPATLRDSLMARLDRLGSARELVQIGAVIGGEFSYKLLQGVTQLRNTNLQEGLKRATDAELLYVRGIAPDASYMFKHALVRDAAYEALLKSRRRELHLLIARTLKGQSPDNAESEPELIAHHLTEAGEIDDAIAGWDRAGARAVGRGALKEAENHYHRAALLLDALGDGPELARRKLTANLALGQVMQSTHGFAAPAVASIYARVRTLAAQFGNGSDLVYALIGIWTTNLSRRALTTAQAIADQTLASAESQGQADLLAWGHYVCGATHYQRGDLGLAYDHLNKAHAFYREADPPDTPYDAGVSTLAYLGRTAWHLGLADTARVHNADALALAEVQNKPASKALALSVAAGLHLSLSEPQRAEEYADELAVLAANHRMPFFLFDAEVLRGSAIADQGHLEEGVKLMRAGLARQLAETGLSGISYYTYLLCRALIEQERLDDAASAIDQSFTAFPEREIDHAYILCLRGEVALRRSTIHGVSGAEYLDAAESGFDEALTLARLMGAKPAELLAVTSLAQVLAVSGKRSEAHQLLAPVCSSFSEGLEAPAVLEAKRLIATLVDPGSRLSAQ